MPKADAPTANIPEGLVITPGGPRDPSLVHPVKPGIAIDVGGDADTIQLVDPESHAVVEEVPKRPGLPTPDWGEGWIAYAYWENETGAPLSSFATTWRVPPPAAADHAAGQTVFLFNGIQNKGQEFGILQPVLQWGPSAAGGGEHWSIASWYVTSEGNAFHTDLIEVNTGEILVGFMEMFVQAETTFSYQCEFTSVENTPLRVLNIAELCWCNETLEGYRIKDRNGYPAAKTTRFSDIEILTEETSPAVAWTPENAYLGGPYAVPDSGPTNGGRVDIRYAPA